MLPLLAIVGITFSPPPPPRPLQDQLFLRAIREVETGDNPQARPGAHGELGAYQFTHATWRRHTRLPFADARTWVADTVARKHLTYLRSLLHSRGMGVTPWTLAIAWNAGPGVLLPGHHIPHSARDYAGRVLDTFHALQLADRP